MQIVIHLGTKPLTLNFREFDEEIDVDQLTHVNYGNIYGEAVTVPALLNHVGMLKAQAEKILAEKKLALDVQEAELKQSLRKSAVAAGDKMTENGLSEKIDSDSGIVVQRKNVIGATYNLAVIDSMYWSVKSKDQKLNNLIKGVSPEELYNELVDGTINNIVIKKQRSITDMKK